MVILEHLEQVRYKFTELGRTISETSDTNKESFEDIEEGVIGFQNLIDALSDEAITGLSNSIESSVKFFPKISSMYSEAFLDTDEVFKSLNSKVGEIEKAMSGALLSEKVLEGGAPAGFVGDTAVGGIGDEKDDTRRGKSPPGFVSAGVKKEVKGVKSVVGGWGRKLKLPIPGAMLAGGILWMAFGFQRKDRIRAEAGEVKNLLVSMFDDGIKGIVEKGTKQISALQEHMQKFMNISRQEVQGVVKAFGDGGISVNSMLGDVDNSMGLVGKNFLTYTLAIDKLFELAGGQSATRMVQIMSDYGKDIKEAKDSLINLMLAGRQSGIGTMQFVKNVQIAGDELKKFGFDIDVIIDLTLTMQKHFEELGVPKQFAGRQTAMGLKQLASGLMSMSDSWQVFIAEKLGYAGETPLAKRQAMRESFSRVARDGGYEELIEMISRVTKVAVEAARGDESLARYIMENSLGFGFEGANIALEIKEAIDKGNIINAKNIAVVGEEELRRSFETEKQKQSQTQREMNRWMEGISKIGEGILGLIGQGLANLVAFFKSAHAMSINYLTGNEEANKKIEEKLDQMIKGDISRYTNTMVSGLEEMQIAAKKGGSDIFGGLLDALTWDPMKESGTLPKTSGGVSTEPHTPSPMPIFGGGVRPNKPIIQTIIIPVKEPGVYKTSSGVVIPPTVKTRVSSEKNKWVGGNLSIISEGVNDKGDIKLFLSGNCPRCGLVYGRVGDNNYKDNMNRKSRIDGLSGGNVEVFNPNTGKSVFVDPTSDRGMSRVSEMSVGGKARTRGKETEELDPKLGKILSQISERFPGKHIKMYRGATEVGKEHTHSKGKAMDIGVEGVRPEELFKFLLSDVEGGGKGFYPKRPFVHIDTRKGKAHWIDFSGKGEKSGKTIGGAKALSWFRENTSDKDELAVSKIPEGEFSG